MFLIWSPRLIVSFTALPPLIQCAKALCKGPCVLSRPPSPQSQDRKRGDKVEDLTLSLSPHSSNYYSAIYLLLHRWRATLPILSPRSPPPLFHTNCALLYLEGRKRRPNYGYGPSPISFLSSAARRRKGQEKYVTSGEEEKKGGGGGGRRRRRIKKARKREREREGGRPPTLGKNDCFSSATEREEGGGGGGRGERCSFSEGER